MINHSEILSFTDRLKTVTTMEKAFDVFDQELHQHGIKHTLYSFLPTLPRQKFSQEAFVFQSHRKEFMDAYWGNGFIDHDFHVSHCLNSTEVKLWSRPEDIALMTAGEKRLLHCSYDFNMSEGLVIPLRGVSRVSRGGVGLAADTTNQADWLRFLQNRQSHLELICQIFHETVLSEGYYNVFNLSPRERDVLKLIACGMNKHDIADQLHISSKTADVHVYRIRQKLKCVNDAQVTAKALVYNLM